MMDDVLTELRLATDALDRGNSAQVRQNEATNRRIEELWAGIAELRDEIHALSNRIESVARIPFTEATDAS